MHASRRLLELNEIIKLKYFQIIQEHVTIVKLVNKPTCLDQ